MLRCQHCDRNIRRGPSGQWLDSDGLWFCMRYQGEPAMAHTPMPVIR